jgi:hypothetical protein
LDTSIIVKTETFYADYNPIESDDNYWPQWGVVWYKNKHLTYNPDGDRMVTLTKKHPKDKTYLSIDYLYSDFLIPNLTTGSLQKLKKDDVYKFVLYDDRNKPWQIDTMYWHEDFGIIKYATHDGSTWNRINL